MRPIGLGLEELEPIGLQLPRRRALRVTTPDTDETPALVAPRLPPMRPLPLPADEPEETTP